MKELAYCGPSYKVFRYIPVIVLFRAILFTGVDFMENYETLVEELMKLSPAELIKVLDLLTARLETRHNLTLVQEIIERYRSALEKLAYRR